ncbi:MAG: hypothetical protein KDA85_16265 [Planctomycetaceae bacterium]|nr:hypothetical protein [Planctomycetaceae bacterium]
MNQLPSRFVRSLVVVFCLTAVVSLSLLSDSVTGASRPQRGADDQIGAPPRKADMQEFMARKLHAAQLALEGVSTNDFAVLEETSEQMIDLSRHAAWQQLASPGYIQDTADFVSAAEFLNRMAQARDADGTAVAYSRLILCCANCHQHVRLPPMAAIPSCRGVVIAESR